MASTLRRTFIRSVLYLFPDTVGSSIAKLFSRKLKKELYGQVTDGFLELLLGGMDLAFYLSKGYRKNIKGFEGRYVFRAAGNLVAATATFKNGDMNRHGESLEDWDVRITFKDAAAFRAFIFSKDQDILDSLLANDVEVDGNLNYLYKFGFMARDLAHRLGVG